MSFRVIFGKVYGTMNINSPFVKFGFEKKQIEKQVNDYLLYRAIGDDYTLRTAALGDALASPPFLRVFLFISFAFFRV